MPRAIASFSLLGVKIRFDASWILLALLIAWSLAAGTFPELYRGLPQSSYWGMAAAAIVGVALSIILHELGHTLAGRAFGMPVSSITLFMFGGVAELEAEPKAPVAELCMAVAGPLVSVGLGFGFVLLGDIAAQGAPQEFAGVLHYLGVLNFTLAAFNMVPAFPLDGGRALRALIWLATGDAQQATRIAARAGEVIALLMMGLGGLAAITLALVAGLWWVVLGWFIYAMARAHRADAEARLLLSGARVRDLMTPNPVTAAAEMNVADFVETVLWRTPHELIPVMAGETLFGAAGFNQVRAAPREAWPRLRLADIAAPIADLVCASPNEPIETALDRMRTAHASSLIVLDKAKVDGVLTLSDIAAHLRLRSSLAAMPA